MFIGILALVRYLNTLNKSAITIGGLMDFASLFDGENMYPTQTDLVLVEQHGTAYEYDSFNKFEILDMLNLLQSEKFLVRQVVSSNGVPSDEDIIILGEKWNWKCESVKIRRYLDLMK